MAHKEELERAVYDQQLIVNALHSDLSNPQRMQDEIDRKQDQVNKLLADIRWLEDRQSRLPSLLQAAESKLATLRHALKVAKNPDIRKLLRLAKKLENEGSDS